MKRYLLLILLIMAELGAQQPPLKIGVIGLTHTHVHWIFNSAPRGDIEIVGIVEPDRELARVYAEQYNYPMDRVFDSMEELLRRARPEAVAAFNSIYEHLEVVETFAPEGIHIMVEKPLAVNIEHARKMQDLAQTHGIHLLTNYETTWYPTNHKAFEFTRDSLAIGAIRKIVVRDGHKGPKRIGVNDEFLEWLIDPTRNGGGALIDFGCYGANLVTWLMEGRRPNTVSALVTQLQAENNPLVDDEAIVLLDYGESVAIVQGSWNWPIARKDLEIFGTRGVIHAVDRHQLTVRTSTGYDTYKELPFELEERPAPFDDPFAFLAAVVRGDHVPGAHDLSSLENNMIVMEILDAARRSAEEGVVVRLDRAGNE